jgi:hypothetical protein
MADTQTLGYVSPSAATQVRSSEVNSELTSLEKNIEELAAQVKILEDRLFPVLRVMEASSTGSAPNTEPSRVPLAQTICDNKRRIAFIGAQIASIMDRIEL